MEPESAPAPVVQSAVVTFEELAYFKLKATLFEIAMQESQLAAQATQLAQRKIAVLAAAGLVPASYAFSDATFSVERVVA